MNENVPLLTVKELSVEFRTRQGVVKALENVSFVIQERETVGIVGESGSGKSVLSYAMMGVLDEAGQITNGQIELTGQDLLSLKTRDAYQLRRKFSMIFQNPRAALNPIRPIGQQLLDVLTTNRHNSTKNSRSLARGLLEKVKIPHDRFSAYPFQLSGGMCQRVLIALALARTPLLLIADEPTTGLDVVTQKSIMELIQGSAGDSQMSTILITHDLALASHYCQRILVMHAGHLVEAAPTKILFQNPRHPYTAKLIAAMPGMITNLKELEAIPGQLPDLRKNLPSCRYSLRCERFEEKCNQVLHQEEIIPNHSISCWNPL